MNHFVLYINLTVLFVFLLIIVSTFFKKTESFKLRLFFSLPFFIVIITCISNLALLHFQNHKLVFIEGLVFIITLLYGPSLMGYTYTLTNQKIPKSINYVFLLYIPLLVLFISDIVLVSTEQFKKTQEIISGENTTYNILNFINLMVAVYFCVKTRIKINRVSKENDASDYFQTKNIRWASEYINYMIWSMVVFSILVIINGIFLFIPMVQMDLVALPLFMLTIYSFIVIKSNVRQHEVELECNRLQVESKTKLQEQKLTISRDLHDNIGSQLTFIISSVDNVKYAFDIENSKLDEKLTDISSFAKDTIVELRDTIWAMNSDEITFEDLESRIHNFIGKAKEVKDEIQFSFETDADLKTTKLTSVEGMNLYRSIQEALNNAIKYADATSISIAAKKMGTQTQITIQDNGIGFDEAKIQKGNGLQNMQKRIEDINGNFRLESSNQGTTITMLLNN